MNNDNMVNAAPEFNCNTVESKLGLVEWKQTGFSGVRVKPLPVDGYLNIGAAAVLAPKLATRRNRARSMALLASRNA